MMENFADLASGATQLEIHLHTHGDITIRGGDSAGWRLEWSSHDDQAPVVERHGDRLLIRQHDEWSHGRADLDLRVSVPEGLEQLSVHTATGSIDAVGGSQRTRLGTGSGSIRLRGRGGDIQVSTGNGEVTITGTIGGGAVHTGNGSISVESVTGDLHANTGNGQIDVLAGDGSVHAQTGNGEIRVTRPSGEVELRTANGQLVVVEPQSATIRAETHHGQVQIRGGSVRSARLRSGSGDLTCGAVLEQGRHEMQTGKGDITVFLAPDARARIEAQTGKGKVNSEFPLVQVGRSGPAGFGAGLRMVGSIGEGEPQIEVAMRTGKGEIHLRRTGGAGSEGSVTWGQDDEGRVGAWRFAQEIDPPHARHPHEHRTSSREGWPVPPPSVGVAGVPPLHMDAPVPPTPPTPPVPPTSPVSPMPPVPPVAGGQHDRLDSLRAILEAVARGDVSPAEADELLERLPQTQEGAR